MREVDPVVAHFAGELYHAKLRGLGQQSHRLAAEFGGRIVDARHRLANR